MKLRLADMAGKRILLLQGPVGPFFSRLAADLTAIGAEVFKVNFNGGDWVFSLGVRNVLNYRGTLEAWPEFYRKFISDNSIDVVILFGDCRPIHSCINGISCDLNIIIGVFEEGYVRPDYITFERCGVNGNSLLPPIPSFYYAHNAATQHHTVPLGNTFYISALWAITYDVAYTVLKPFFPHYRAHRDFGIKEVLPRLRSIMRKLVYRFSERNIRKALLTSLKGKYFLVPLQVRNDSQIQCHSDFDRIEDFIRFVMESFAKFAPADTSLVFKHHPLDRGHVNYGRAISDIAKRLDIDDRTMYVHDLYLPECIENSCGVVVINSTVGLSALHHNRPLFVCGSAIYNIEGLATSGSLDDFWKAPAKPSKQLYERFLSYIISMNQINGSFYKRMPSSSFKSGIFWT